MARGWGWGGICRPSPASLWSLSSPGKTRLLTSFLHWCTHETTWASLPPSPAWPQQLPDWGGNRQTRLGMEREKPSRAPCSHNPSHFLPSVTQPATPDPGELHATQPGPKACRLLCEWVPSPGTHRPEKPNTGLWLFRSYSGNLWICPRINAG